MTIFWDNCRCPSAVGLKMNQVSNNSVKNCHWEYLYFILYFPICYLTKNDLGIASKFHLQHQVNLRELINSGWIGELRVISGGTKVNLFVYFAYCNTWSKICRKSLSSQVWSWKQISLVQRSIMTCALSKLYLKWKYIKHVFAKTKQ